jgi:hypothetical protein
MNQPTNELGFAKPESQSENALVQVDQSRAVAEVQAAYVIAKKFPRNQSECYANIMDACKRPFLAEQAMYAYPRGGTMVTGASIRLAEAMAQAWGNLDCGVREVSQSNGVSVAEAYAIDLQTNTRVTKIFHVPHVRDTKKGRIKLTDARDIYEMVANQGARRLRACILGILPGDVVEAAVERCKKTLESSDVPISEQIRKMIVAFDEFGVKVEHLEKRLGHKMESTISTEIVALKAIYKSIKDGMASREDFFDIGLGKNASAEADLDNLLADKKPKVNLKTGEITQDDKK